MSAAFQLYGAYAITLSLLAVLMALMCTNFSLRKLSSTHLQIIMKIGLTASLLAPLGVKLGSIPTFLISSGQSFRDTLPSSSTQFPVSLTLPLRTSSNRFDINWNFTILLLLAIGFMFQLLRYRRDWRTIQSYLKAALPLRRIGRVNVMAFEGSGTPFAFRSFCTAYVLIPESFCSDSELFTLSVRHELQHHRQNDTIWIHIWQVLQALFFWHPGVHLLIRRMSEIQELACDEALLGRADISVNAYSRCLVKAAQSAMENYRMLVGTTSMAESSSSKKLTRRIQMMFKTQVKHSPSAFGAATALMVSMVTTLAFANESLTRSNFLSLEEVQAAITERSASQFPIEVNSEILNELNIFIATESGREFIRASLERRKLYADIFEQNFINKVPAELEAVALVESGFQNLSEKTKAPHSAGMWQFIPQTARNFGLRVDETMDNRLDISQATDAAARLLASLELRFQDWRLAILAYNTGASRVQEGINKTKSRDPWVLIQSGFAGDSAYLAKVMAGVLLLQNPDWIRKD